MSRGPRTAAIAGSRYWLAAAGVGAAAVLVLAGSRKLGPDHLHIDRTLQTWILLTVAVAAGAVACLARAVVWREALLEGAAPRRSPPFAEVAGPALAGATLNALLGARLGEPARAILVRRRFARLGEDVAPPALAGAAIAENLAATTAWLGCSAALALAFPPPAWAWLATLPVLAACGLAIAVIAAGRSQRGLALVGRAHGVGGRVRTVARLAGVLVASEASLGRVRWPRLVAVAAFGWMAQLAVLVAVLDAFGLQEITPSALPVLLLTTACSAVFVAPGNLVAFQAGVALPLGILYSVPVATALAVGATLQIVRVAGAAGVGSLTLLRERSRLRDAPAPPVDRPPVAWRHPLLYDLGVGLVPWTRLLRTREQAAVHEALAAVAAPTDAVLEVGAGTGWYTGMVADLAWRVRAVEPAPAMRARLVGRLAREGTGNVSVEDGRLPLERGDEPSADGVVCIGVLDYFEDLTAGLVALADQMAPGGWVVCTVPARGPGESARRHRLPHQARSYGRDLAELADCAHAAGLEVTRASTVRVGGRPRTIVASLRAPRRPAVPPNAGG